MFRVGKGTLFQKLHKLHCIADVLARFKERLEVLSRELRSCAKRPGEALLKAVKIFIEAVRRHVDGMFSYDSGSPCKL